MPEDKLNGITVELNFFVPNYNGIEELKATIEEFIEALADMYPIEYFDVTPEYDDGEDDYDSVF